MALAATVFLLGRRRDGEANDRLTTLAAQVDERMEAMVRDLSEALERAQALMSINVCTREEKAAIAHALEGSREDPSPLGHQLDLPCALELDHARLIRAYDASATSSRSWASSPMR